MYVSDKRIIVVTMQPRGLNNIRNTTRNSVFQISETGITPSNPGAKRQHKKYWREEKI